MYPETSLTFTGDMLTKNVDIFNYLKPENIDNLIGSLKRAIDL